MLKAVVNRGEIRPLEPMPPDWQEGQLLLIEKADDEARVEDIDRDFAVLANLCDSSETAEEEQRERALLEQQRQAKEQTRRKMELP